MKAINIINTKKGKIITSEMRTRINIDGKHVKLEVSQDVDFSNIKQKSSEKKLK